LHYKRPTQADPAGVQFVVNQIVSLDVSLVVIDGVTEAMAMFGLDPEKSAKDAATFMALLPRPLAEAGAATACIDHVVKNKDARGKFAFGSQHKLAGIDGVSYAADAVVPFARGRSGTVMLTVGKDRSGWHRTGDKIQVQITADPDGTVAAEFTAPDPKGQFRPTKLMAKVVEYLSGHDGAAKGELRGLGKGDYVNQAVDLLEAEGYVRVERVGKSHRHHLTGKPYVAED
jgi:hypothetical protein